MSTQLVINPARVRRLARVLSQLTALDPDLFREDEYASLLLTCLEKRRVRVSMAKSPLATRLASLEDYEERFMPCEAAFRFTRNEITQLVEALSIPNPFITSHGDNFPAWEAFVILLRKLANPLRYTFFIFPVPVPDSPLVLI